MFLLTGCGIETRTYAPVEGLSIPTPARGMLLSDQEEPSGFGAYGYLIFTKRPTPDNLERYELIFHSLKFILEPVDEYSYNTRATIMPTYWLSKSKVLSHNCNDWIQSYDYSRAKTIASAIKVLSSEGPILVAWSQPFGKAIHNEIALVLDLSNFSNGDINRAFGIWMDRITRNPKTWHNGFNMVLAREAFRNLLEKYGDHIIKSVKTIKGIIG